MQAVSQLAVFRRILQVGIETFRAKLVGELLRAIRAAKREKEIHVVGTERIRAALAQLVDEPRIPGIVLALTQLLQVLPDAPAGDQSAQDGEHVQPGDAEFHPLIRPRRW
jgi:hypothetical protein